MQTASNWLRFAKPPKSLSEMWEWRGLPSGPQCCLGMSFWLSTLGTRRLEDRCACSLRELSAATNEGTKPSGTALDRTVKEPCSLLPLNHRAHAVWVQMSRLGLWLDIVQWVPVTTATQVHLLRIEVDGVQCVLPGALGPGCYRWGSPEWHSWATDAPHDRCQSSDNIFSFRGSPEVV